MVAPLRPMYRPESYIEPLGGFFVKGFRLVGFRGVVHGLSRNSLARAAKVIIGILT